jgi:phytol kinase
MLRNIIALVITFVVAVLWLRLNDYAAHKGWIGSRLSRKFIHMGTGPLYVLCWLFFEDVYYARFMAALVPFLITLQFILVGMGIIQDESAVKAMSRSGDRREILKGPLFYGLIFVILTIVFWYDTPIGILALMLMCGGDGLADILGRRFGNRKLPWNSQKSWVGSLGMFGGGWLFSSVVLLIYILAGVFPGDWISYFPVITVIALGGTFIESLPIKDVDNITVTLTAVLLGYILF